MPGASMPAAGTTQQRQCFVLDWLAMIAAGSRWQVLRRLLWVGASTDTVITCRGAPPASMAACIVAAPAAAPAAAAAAAGPSPGRNKAAR